MKKLLSILVIGLTVLFLLSFIPSNTMDEDATLGSNDSFALTVAAKPPKTPPRK